MNDSTHCSCKVMSCQRKVLHQAPGFEAFIISNGVPEADAVHVKSSYREPIAAAAKEALLLSQRKVSPATDTAGIS